MGQDKFVSNCLNIYKGKSFLDCVLFQDFRTQPRLFSNSCENFGGQVGLKLYYGVRLAVTSHICKRTDTDQETDFTLQDIYHAFWLDDLLLE
jgi:hypothetical protein